MTSIPVILKTHTLKPSNSPSPVFTTTGQYLSFWRHIHLNLAIHRHLTLTTTPHQYLSFWRHIHLNLAIQCHVTSPLPPSIPVILKTHTLKPSNSPSPHSHHYPHQYLSFWRHIHLNLAIHRHLTSPLPPSIPVILKTHTVKPSNSPSPHSHHYPTSIPVILKTHTLKPSNSPSPHSHHYPHQYLSFWRHIHLNLAIHRHLTLTTTPINTCHSEDTYTET